MEESHKPAQPLPSDQTNSARANATEQYEQLPKKDYQQPKLALLGTVRTITAKSTIC